ncbi:MAG: SurA N-terminal domain-containing protein [Desulfobacter sp.]|nr:SurA N-terminal domain-containing protein [Desulfobacter sp.]WDP88113.1 MAG: SurA N-terminal domain-containing protein [Desulfobacter sp.]
MVKIRQIIFLGIGMAMMGFFSQSSAEVIDRIVAIVNNDIVTLSELNKATMVYRKNIQASQNSDTRKQELITQLESDMLNQLVESSLTIQEAGKYGIEVKTQDVDRAIENFKTANKIDDEGLERGLAAEGMTIAEYREKMKDQILQSMLVNRAVRSKIVITDEDIQTYYDAHKDEFIGIKKYQLRNILSQSQDEITLVENRLKSGESFADLAQEFSIGSNASQGGELGLFDINSFSQDIKTALEGLKKGDHTPVMKTGSAFQIIYVEDIIMEGNQTADQAKTKIQNILFKEQGQKQFNQWMESLKQNAHIKLML